MAHRDIVVIGASAGGLAVLQRLMAMLPSDFPASLFIAMHLSPDHPSLLAEILRYRAQVPVQEARDGELLRPGCVYVAVPDQHLLLDEGRIRLSHGPKENRFRPSVDVLFRSAARAYGPRVIGVILSGGLDDGVSGLYAIKARGGRAVVQDPREAQHPSMPLEALRAVTVDHVVHSEGLASLLDALTRESVDPAAVPTSPQLEIEVLTALGDSAMEREIMDIGELSPLTCPECHGTLLRFQDGGRSRFRCHTGHAFSLNSLLVGLTSTIEEQLWTALRAFQEGEMLLIHMAEHYATAGETALAAQLQQRAAFTSSQADLVRQVVFNHRRLSMDNLREPEEHLKGAGAPTAPG